MSRTRGRGEREPESPVLLVALHIRELGASPERLDEPRRPTSKLGAVRVLEAVLVLGPPDPIREIRPHSIVTEDGTEHPVDVIVSATGFSTTRYVHPAQYQGRGGQRLEELWESGGPRAYMGVCAPGFPNFFTITGPGSPSVLANMVVCAEQHVEWIGDLFVYVREHGYATVEATRAAQDAWVDEVNRVADGTMYTAPTCNSWYLGDNIPGKVRVFLPYVGGLHTYIEHCDEVAASGYDGFEFT